MFNNKMVNGIIIGSESECQFSDAKLNGFVEIDQEIGREFWVFGENDIIALENYQAILARTSDGRSRRKQEMWKYIETLLQAGKAPISTYTDKRTREYKDLKGGQYIYLGQEYRVDHVKWSAIFSAYYSVERKQIENARSWAAVWH